MRLFASKRGFLLAALAVAALHVGLVNHFVPFALVFGREPISGDDFDLHIGQVYRVVEGLMRFGHSWVYDVKLVAGQPEGTITDAGSKGWELYTFALHALGVRKELAFNSFVLLVCLGCPFAVYAAGRLFRLPPWPSLLAALMASTLWFFDSFAHWLWWIGMVSYASTAYFGLIPLALFYRFVESGRARYALCCAPLLGVVHLIHPYSFFALALPFAALYLRAFRKMKPAAHAQVAGIVLVTFAINAYWLRSAALHWHYILNSAYYAQAHPRHLLTDFFNLMRTAVDTGVIGNRTGFRFLYMALGACGLLLWRARRDPLFLPFATGLAAMFVLSYVRLPGLSQVQPYRNVLPLGLWSCLPAAAWVAHVVREGAVARAPRPVQALLGVAALLLVQHLGMQALYYFPEIVPYPDRFPDGSRSPVSQYGYLALGPMLTHPSYRMPRSRELEPDLQDVVDWVERHVPAGGRVLIDHSVLGERLAWKTHAEVLGGFLERNVGHAYANFFRSYGDRKVPIAELARYLRLFNVGHVILFTPHPNLEKQPKLLQSIGTVGRFHIYRTKIFANPVLLGSGKVKASTNRIEVRGSDPAQDLVLSYHFHPMLRCEPGCRIVREDVNLDRVGLIRVPAPHPRDLLIVNRY